jgi:hypothetical protein
MKKISLAVLLAFCLATVFNSCKKKDDPKPIETPSKSAMLTNKEWKITACVISPTLMVDYGGIKFPVSNLFDPQVQSLAACATDDIFEFKAIDNNAVSGGFSRKSNTQCNGEPDQTGTWAFNSDQTQIVATTQGNTKTTFNIIELTDKILKVTFTMMNPIDKTDTKTYTANTTLEPK